MFSDENWWLHVGAFEGHSRRWIPSGLNMQVIRDVSFIAHPDARNSVAKFSKIKKSGSLATVTIAT